jgi:hypothetical protein
MHVGAALAETADRRAGRHAPPPPRTLPDAHPVTTRVAGLHRAVRRRLDTGRTRGTLLTSPCSTHVADARIGAYGRSPLANRSAVINDAGAGGRHKHPRPLTGQVADGAMNTPPNIRARAHGSCYLYCMISRSGEISPVCVFKFPLGHVKTPLLRFSGHAGSLPGPGLRPRGEWVTLLACSIHGDSAAVGGFSLW